MADFTPKDWQTGDLITETDMDRIEQGIAQAFQLIADLPDAPTTAVPSGPAGGALDGNYPNPGLSTYHVDQITGGRVNDSSSATGVAVRNVAQAAVAAIVDAAPENLNTLKEISDRLANDSNVVAALTDLIGTKATPAQITQAINALPIPLTLSAFTAAVQGTPGFGGSGSNTYIGAARSQLTAPAFGSSVSNRGANRSVATSFGTTNLIETTRVRHVLTEDVGSIHLVYMGWYGGETDQVDATIKATIETATGSLHKLTFRGSRTHLLTNGSSVTTDPLGLVLKKGDLVWVRTTRTIASGTYYANTILRGLSGEGKVLTDSADTGTIAAAADDNSVGGFTAAALVSAAPSLGNSAIFIGDSVSNGKGEGYFDNSVPPVFIPVEERGGYMARATPDNVGIFRLNAGGGNALTFIANTVNAGGSRRRLPFATSGRYAWVEYGINDINSATDAQTVKDTLTKLWTTLAGMGLQVFQSTLTLWSGGSTDGYTTLENQTLWAKHAIRVEINDWIRTKPAPLTGYFEMADQIESSRNSGKWRVDLGALTTDGIHPNTLGHQTIAAAIAPAVSAAFTYTPVATTPGTSGPVSWGSIPDKPTSFTPSAHSHPVSDISGFTDAVQAVPGFGGGGTTNPTYVRDIREWVQSGETLTRDRTGDNSVIIQRAVNALTAEYAAQTTTFSANKLGYQIYFPNGRYRTTTKIIWKTGVGIAGQSRENVVFYPVGDQSFIDGSTTPNTYTYDDCIFQNFSVDGSEQAVSAYTTGVKGIFIQYMRRAVFQFVTVRNTWATGFGVDFLETARFSQCAAINNGRGLTALGSNKSSSSGHSGFGIGVGFWAVEAVTIEDCVALNNGLNGIFTEKLEQFFSKGLVVTGNISRGNYNGFKDAGSIGAIVANNQFIENSKNGVTIDGTVLQPLAGYDGIISNNYIQGNGVGVRIGNMQPTKGYTIRGNEITGNVGAGVEILAGAVIGQRTRFSGNRIHENAGIGFSCAAASTMLTLKDNEFWGNVGSDLSLTGSVTATGLAIIDNDLRGANVILSQTIASDSIFRGNLGFATNSPRTLSTTAGSTNIAASWIAPLEGTPDSYNLQYKLTSGGTWTPVTLSSPTATTADITGLTGSTSYDLRVNAVKASVTSDWTTKTTSTLAAVGGTLFADNFNRADTAAGALGTTSTGSATWTAPEWGITSNAAQSTTAGPTIATFDTAVADHYVEAKLTAKPTSVSTVLLGRYLGSSAWVGLSTASGGNWFIQAFTGSFVTILDTGVAWAIGQTVGLRVTGNTFTAYLNGAEIGTGTSAVGAGGTRVGFRASLAGIAWDDIKVTS